MRFAVIIGCALVLSLSLLAQQLLEVNLVGTPSSQHLCWPTQTEYNYQIDSSADLQTWTDTCVIVAGTGSTVTHDFSDPAESLFYRVRGAADAYNGNFLTLPTEAQELDLTDGVCLAFNLNVFPELPAKIHVYKRPYNVVAPWEKIGTVTEFTEIDGIKIVRGATVWIPDTEGDYEVRAAVLDGTGTVIACATRLVILGKNEAPSITITDGPASPSATAQAAEFRTTVTDTEDEILRVEFYDNGILIGTDRLEPFGDIITDLEAQTYQFLRGTHSVTAKVYDSRGACGVTVAPFVTEITAGNARPELTITSPPNGFIVQQGQSFTIEHTHSDADGESDLTGVSAYNLNDSNLGASDLETPFDPLTIDTTDWEPGTHIIKVVASDFLVDSYPSYLTISVRSGTGATFAESLVANIVDESSVAPSNESFTGIQVSSDEFVNGIASGLQIDEGIVVTSGLSELWNGGNNHENAWEILNPSFVNNAEPGDPELEDRIVGFRTNDAAILEFDVFCTYGQLELDYQFGSEEYDEYVGSHNDAFMVTVDGVVTSLVPDCSDIVAVNSVNSVGPENEHLYLDNDLDIKPTVAPENYPTLVEYDGMTIRMRAHAFVTPNQTHRIRLVIADVNDDWVDSGLFIGAGSVRSVPPSP